MVSYIPPESDTHLQLTIEEPVVTFPLRVGDCQKIDEMFSLQILEETAAAGDKACTL